MERNKHPSFLTELFANLITAIICLIIAAVPITVFIALIKFLVWLMTG